MKYLVIKSFIDKETHIGYNAGNTFESDDKERIAFLQENEYLNADKGNKDDALFPKHLGGGWYQLSNGEKIHGKQDAEFAESKIASGPDVGETEDPNSILENNETGEPNTSEGQVTTDEK